MPNPTLITTWTHPGTGTVHAMYGPVRTFCGIMGWCQPVKDRPWDAVTCKRCRMVAQKNGSMKAVGGHEAG